MSRCTGFVSWRTDNPVFTSARSSKFLGEEPGLEPFTHQKARVWTDCESVCLSQPAEGWSIWINEQFGAKHKYHRHLAIGTDNQVIHQIQNCLEWLMQSWRKEDPQLMGRGEERQSRKNNVSNLCEVPLYLPGFLFTICWRLRGSLHCHTERQQSVLAENMQPKQRLWDVSSLTGFLCGLNELIQ